jgi:hypothetical protein
MRNKSSWDDAKLGAINTTASKQREGHSIFANVLMNSFGKEKFHAANGKAQLGLVNGPVFFI